MTFRARNSFYLRISDSSVLPLYVYLDERHIEWMSDRMLQYVLADLRPLIVPKLRAEADVRLESGGPPNAKRGSVDVHRGDFYQFAFFFRKSEPHSVLIKTRSFVAVPRTEKQSQASVQITTSEKARNDKEKPWKGARKRKAQVDKDKQLDETMVTSGEDDDGNENRSQVVVPRRSKRPRKLIAGGYGDEEVHDVDMENDDLYRTDAPLADILAPAESLEDGTGLNTTFLSSTATDVGEPSLAVKHEDADVTISLVEAEVETSGSHESEMPLAEQPPTNETVVDLEVDDEEVKPKPLLRLQYKGFSIHGKCLCVVIEPWPLIRAASRALSVAPLGGIAAAARERSIAPPSFVPSGGSETREKTPLFLPDFDRDRSETPFPSFPTRSYPPVPLFNDPGTPEREEDDYDEMEGLISFSQAVNITGEYQGGTAEDEDEMDGAVFFGDADETREL